MNIHNLALIPAVMALGISSASAAERSVGVLFGEFGPGINYSNALPFSIKEDDTLQLRLQLSGLSTGGSDEYKEKGNTYTGDIDLSSHKVTADWFPFEQSQFFVTGGLGYLKTDFNVKNKAGSGYTVGDISVGNDGSSLDLTVDQSAVAPYVGIGWGNKLAGKSGLAFFAELGVMKPLDDAKVSLSSTSSSVSEADIAMEKRELEDAFNDVRLSAALGLSYRF